MDTEIKIVAPVNFPENAWDIRHDESSMAYEAFIVYRDLGIRRTLVDAARQMGRTSASQLHKWAATHKWMDRVKAYDTHLDRIRQVEHEHAVREMSKRQAELGLQMQELATARITDFVGNEDLRATMTSRDAVHLATEGVKIERLARGKSTENTDKTIKIVLPFMPDWAPQSVKNNAEVGTIEGEQPTILELAANSEVPDAD